MSAKEVRFSTEAREKMLRGVDILANAVRVTLGPRCGSTCPSNAQGLTSISDAPMASRRRLGCAA
jgi:hypothetical protein